MTNLDIVLNYLSRQKPTTHVVVSAASGRHSIGSGGNSGGEVLRLGPVYYEALPVSVRDLLPLRAMPGDLPPVVLALSPGDSRYVGTVAQVSAAVTRALADATASVRAGGPGLAPAPRATGFSRTGVILIAAGLGLAWLLTRRTR